MTSVLWKTIVPYFSKTQYKYNFMSGHKNICVTLNIMVYMLWGIRFSCGIQRTRGDIQSSRCLWILKLNSCFSGQEHIYVSLKIGTKLVRFQKIHSHKNIEDLMFTATLFMLTSNWKQSTYPSIIKQINETRYVHSIKRYLAIPRNKPQTRTMTWIHLKSMISERNQIHETTYCVVLLYSISEEAKL